MSFRELLQVIAMLLPTLLVVIAATLSLTHPDDPPGPQQAPIAQAPQAAFPYARAPFNAADGDDDER